MRAQRLGENRVTMMERSALPSGFWLLLCIVSFVASAVAWNSRRTEPSQAKAQTGESYNVVPAGAAAPAAEPSKSDAASAPDAPADNQAVGAAANPVPGEPPRILPIDTGTGTKVLRCTVRGRVTYVDPSSACPDGAAGKITVLPR